VSLDRREFLKGLAGIGGTALAAACAGAAHTSAASDAARVPTSAWRDRIGLQLYTVRDRFPTDYPGTLDAVARIGYTSVQPTLSYGGHTPEEVRAYLDRAGLTAPATHVSPPNGADFERTLDGYRRIGHRYTTVRVDAPAWAEGAPPTRAMVQRTAAALDAAGRITARHGIKVIVHNHTEEFTPLADGPGTVYDVLLAETDPALVAMELDIGWATAAGQDALALFRQAPGRFEVWHVKDMAGLAALRALGTQQERHRAARIVPLGAGEIDYRPIFAQASLAGLRHFFVEQDTAPDSGDSLAAAATSYRALRAALS
jgi:sugar phosphate isomerase/epimerase